MLSQLPREPEPLALQFERSCLAAELQRLAAAPPGRPRGVGLHETSARGLGIAQRASRAGVRARTVSRACL
eukprot:scaffold4_cov247-Pinguiococcus_pyrenoidosus.AAC.13